MQLQSLFDAQMAHHSAVCRYSTAHHFDYMAYFNNIPGPDEYQWPDGFNVFHELRGAPVVANGRPNIQSGADSVLGARDMVYEYDATNDLGNAPGPGVLSARGPPPVAPPGMGAHYGNPRLFGHFVATSGEPVPVGNFIATSGTPDTTARSNAAASAAAGIAHDRDSAVFNAVASGTSS